LYSLNLDLVREIERSIARSGREAAECSRRHKPEACADFAVAEMCGGTAVFTGVGSPVTQALGCGLDGSVTAAQLDEMEEFFFSRGASCDLELAPFIDASLVELLRHRGYHLSELSIALLRDLREEIAAGPEEAGFVIRPIESGEERLFTEAVAQGFADVVPVTEELLDVVESFAHQPGSRSFLALVDGVVAGGGSAGAHGRVGALFGASTLPMFRGRGIQSALIGTRMHWMREQGCEFAYITTAPGTASQRNAERAGFRANYSRMKLTRDRP